MTSDHPPSPDPRQKRDMADLSQGLQFGVTTLLSLALGVWLDKKYGSSPWGLLGGLFLGALIGMINLARSVK